MPSLQQQAPYLTGSHPVRRQASVPRAGLDEHCRSDVYGPIGGIGAIICGILLSFFFYCILMISKNQSAGLLRRLEVGISHLLSSGHT